MTKGIGGLFKSFSLIGRSKSEVSGPCESRAKSKLEQTRQRKVSFDPHARDIRLDMARVANMQPSRIGLSNPATQQEAPPTAKHSGSPPKASEPPPPTPTPIDTDPLQRNIELTLDELRAIGRDFDDDVEAAMLEIQNPMDEGTLMTELTNELGRLIPDEESPASPNADKEVNRSDRSTPTKTAMATNEGTERDRTIGSAEKPRPRELRRRHLHQQDNASSTFSPERRGVVTRHRPTTTPKTPEK